MPDWYALTQTVSTNFMEHEYRRLAKAKDNLVRQNDLARASRGDEKNFGFIYDGRPYRLQDAPTHFNVLPAFEERLVEEIKSFVGDQDKVDSDRTKIRQICVLLLLPVNSYQDARNALPDELGEAHPEIAKLSRAEEMDFYIMSERTRRQLAELQDLIGFYSATRLIY